MSISTDSKETGQILGWHAKGKWETSFEYPLTWENNSNNTRYQHSNLLHNKIQHSLWQYPWALWQALLLCGLSGASSQGVHRCQQFQACWGSPIYLSHKNDTNHEIFTPPLTGMKRAIHTAATRLKQLRMASKISWEGRFSSDSKAQNKPCAAVMNAGLD